MNNRMMYFMMVFNLLSKIVCLFNVLEAKEPNGVSWCIKGLTGLLCFIIYNLKDSLKRMP